VGEELDDRKHSEEAWRKAVKLDASTSTAASPSDRLGCAIKIQKFSFIKKIQKFSRDYMN
jgi:hypothetical protein